MIDALIVTYNSRRYIGRCVRSLRRHVPNCRIHIVDNASTDGTRKLLPRLKPDSLTLNDENRYLSPVWNEFLRDAESKYVLMVNPDLIVEDGQFVGKSLQIMEADDRIVACGRIHVHDLDEFRDYVPPVRPEDKAVIFELASDLFETSGCHRPETPRTFQSLDGCFLVLQRERVRQIGGFCERLPLYYNDAELTLRIARAGYAVAHTWGPGIRSVRHYVQGSTGPYRGMPETALRRLQHVTRYWTGRIYRAVMRRVNLVCGGLLRIEHRRPHD